MQDIQQATRNIIWIKPDHIVVYDRATSLHAGLFKQFNVNVVAIPSIAGHSFNEVTPGGQQLFVQTLLPTNATLTYVPINSITTLSQEEPSVGRVVIEDTNNPVDIRFLHVLQGADAKATPDGISQVASTGGNFFEGATVRGVVALFPVNALSNNFTTVTYSVPISITNHYVAGLTPNSAYEISRTITGTSQQVTVTLGGRLMSDAAGLLSFNNAGQTLSGAPRFNSEVWSGSSLLLTGTGMANLSYSILCSTNLLSPNWLTVGTLNADSVGNFQFLDVNASAYPQRFYQISCP